MALVALVALVGIALACAERDAPSSTHKKQRGGTPPSGQPTAVGGGDPAASSKPPASEAGQPAPAEDAAKPVASEFHLDDALVEYEPGLRSATGRKSRSIELVLRSTPPGAVAAVDGATVGPTPALWEGPADGRAREFTFVLPGYSIARYRFVPTHDGIVHGTLGQVKAQPDAGPIDRTDR